MPDYSPNNVVGAKIVRDDTGKPIGLQLHDGTFVKTDFDDAPLEAGQRVVDAILAGRKPNLRDLAALGEWAERDIERNQPELICVEPGCRRPAIPPAKLRRCASHQTTYLLRGRKR